MRLHRRQLSVGVLAGLGWTAAKVAVPSVTGVAIDRGIGSKGHPAELLWWSAALAALGVGVGVCTGLRKYSAFGAAVGAETDLRQRLFAHLQRLSFAYHDQTGTGELLARAATDLQQVNNLFSLIPISIGNSLIVLSVAVVLLVTDARLAVLALGALPAINFVAKRFSSRVHPVSMELQGELSGLSGIVEETVSGMRVVKGFGAERVFARRVRDQADEVFQRAVQLGTVRASYMPWLDPMVPSLGLLAVAWYGGHQVVAHHLTVGRLTAFYLYVVLLINPLRMTGMLVAQAQRAVASAQRIHQVLATDPAIIDSAQAGALPDGGGEVRFENVSFAYTSGAGAELPVLDGLDLVVVSGEAVALVGATGSGKSTVAHLVPRFYDVTGGRVCLDGADVRGVRLADLRRAVSVVFEDTFLFGDTIAANIAFARPDAPDADIERASVLAGAAEFIAELPDGYATAVGEHGYSLSGGERQRLALARAILANPRVLILDDATSAVDANKEREIRAALAEVMLGRTTIVIAHRVATIALADRVVLIGDGRVIAEGTHTELLASSPAYREVLARAEQGERVATAAPSPSSEAASPEAASSAAASSAAASSAATSSEAAG